MAENVHLFLKIAGKLVEGDSFQKSDGRENSIECLSYEQSMETVQEAGSTVATGRRRKGPVVVRKRIDRASPLLAKALCENQELEAEFKFYRPAANRGDGTTENFYSVTLKGARLASMRQSSPDTLGANASEEPPTEIIGFVADSTEWLHVDGGVSHVDTWNSPR